MRCPCLMLLLMLLGACGNVALTPRPVVPVPPSLSAEEVEVVILFDLANQPLPPEFSHGERIADHALQAVLGWRYRSAAPLRSVWFVESLEPAMITAGYEVPPFYLRATIHYTDTTVTTRILDSRNLNQDATQINVLAVRWMDELDTRIRRALGTAATAKRLAQTGRRP